MGTNRTLPLTALALAIAACGPNVQDIIGAEHVVRDISFEGVTRFKKKELLEHLVLGETSRIPFSRTHYFTPGLLPRDVERIEALYRAYGYYDARVLDVVVEPDGEDVSLTFKIFEGEPVLVRSVDFTWTEAPEIDPGDGVLTELVEAQAETELGAPFEVSALNLSVADMRLALRSRGFALAEVEERAVVDPTFREVELDYTITPGPRARVGQIRIEGLDDVPRDKVERELRFAPGRWYSPRLMERIESQVYALDVFRSVVVLPAETVGPDGTLDLTVRVNEAYPQTIRLGVGVGFEPTRWEQRVTARYTHRNLFGELTRLQLETRLGYAELPTPVDLVEHGPVVVVEPELRKKGLFEEKLIWTWRPSFELGIEEGYQFYSPANRVGVARFFSSYIQTELAHELNYTNFFNISDTFDAASTELRFDFRDPYLLSFITGTLRFHFTDRVVMPRDGVVIGTDYALAGGIFGGDFDFQRIVPSVEAYWTPFGWMELGARLRTGLILPYGDRPGAPVDEKLYLGGADTMRGWGLRRLSPQICEDGGDESDDCDGIPVGGNTMVLGNAEVRVRAIGDLWVATFLDVGDVRAGELDYAPGEWNYSSGLGLRYATPVGKIRFDFGLRLNNPDRFANEPRYAFHLGLGEPF